MFLQQRKFYRKLIIMTIKKTKILFWISGKNDPSPRFRFIQFISPLIDRGLEIEAVYAYPPRSFKARFHLFPILKHLEIYSIFIIRLTQVFYVSLFKSWRYDVIFTNKDLIPNNNIFWAEKFLSIFNNKLVFDIDDAIYLTNRGPKLDRIWKNYAGIIAGSPVHIEYIKPKHPHLSCFYVPMAIDTRRYQPIGNKRSAGKLRVGWSGSHHTNVYALPVIKDCLEELAKQIEFEFIVISNIDPKINWDGVQSKFIKWSEEDEVSGLQLIDIGLMPLRDEPFERGKCALKAVQYMAVGIPALVSPVGVNASIVDDGINGFHCETNQSFVDKILYLSKNPFERVKMGVAARQKVIDKYSIDVLADVYQDIFHSFNTNR